MQTMKAKWANGEGKVSKQWRQSERTLSECKHGKVERFRDCTFSSDPSARVISKLVNEAGFTLIIYLCHFSKYVNRFQLHNVWLISLNEKKKCVYFRNTRCWRIILFLYISFLHWKINSKTLFILEIQQILHKNHTQKS